MTPGVGREELHPHQGSVELLWACEYIPEHRIHLQVKTGCYVWLNADNLLANLSHIASITLSSVNGDSQ